MRLPSRLAAVLIALLSALAQAGPKARSEVRLQPATARPGDAVLVTVRGAAEEPSGTLGERALRFGPITGGHQAITGLPVEEKPAIVALAVQIPGEQNKDDDEIIGTLEIVEAKFAERSLTVAGKYLSPPAKVKKWIAEDKAAFASAFSQKFGPRLFTANFEWPVRTYFTASFGDLRVYNGKKQSQHFGTDLEGRTGDPIYASNDGTVVLSRECYASGNTVVLYHGAGLYTAYFHLSKRQAKPGQKIARGAPLGLVGKTGRVTGPHLHFGVKVDGNWVDPESLLRLDFE